MTLLSVLDILLMIVGGAGMIYQIHLFKYVRDVFKVNAADGADADHCNFDQIEFLPDESKSPPLGNSRIHF